MNWKKVLCRTALLLVLPGLLVADAGCSGAAPERRVKTESVTFTESAKRLENPDRGFFHLHGFVISDEETGYLEEVEQRFGGDTETALMAVQINLREYRDRPISKQGMANLTRLFDALAQQDKHMILRFLYDWDGKGIETEPDTLEQILGHMEQLKPLLNKYGKEIFTLQGVFVGDCGEMHSSKYLSEEDVRTLAEKLAEVTDPVTYLSVRTPAHWRKTVQLPDAKSVKRGDGTLASRLGLFNDGMLGSSSDCGTYGGGDPKKDGPYVNWVRKEELAFQNVLCRLTPNGGEAILDNPYNDLKNAIADMKAMHVTYLSRDYDSGVLEKWAAGTVSEEGCFQGMDGLSYIERHLGYRLVIREAKVRYDSNAEALSVKVSVQNVGFAPVYRETEAKVVLRDTDSGKEISRPISQDVRNLAGAVQPSQRLTLTASIPWEELEGGSWEVYLDLADSATGQRILFGNEQEPEQYGYRIGRAEEMEGA